MEGCSWVDREVIKALFCEALAKPLSPVDDFGGSVWNPDGGPPLSLADSQGQLILKKQLEQLEAPNSMFRVLFSCLQFSKLCHVGERKKTHS
jgi:hypothetical protein